MYISSLSSQQVHSHSLPLVLTSPKFELRGGVFDLGSINTVLRVDSSAGIIGTVIDFEKDLGLSSSDDTFQFEASYYFNSRHSLHLSHYVFERSGIKNLDNVILFADIEVPVDRMITTDFRDEVFKLDYLNTFVTDQRFSMSIGASLRINKLDIFLQSLEDDLTTDEIETVDENFPLILLALNGTYYFTSKLSLTAATRQFLLEVNDVKGVFNDFDLDLNYKAFKNIDLGLRFTKINSDLESKRESVRGEYEVTSSGFYGYISAHF